MGYGVWLHGEAVACGMVMAAKLSAELGWISHEDVQRISTLISRAKLPVSAPDELSTGQFTELMAIDKKVLDGKLRLVLLRAIGNAIVTDEFDQDSLQRVLERSH